MESSQDARVVYADIIDHPHHRSETRAHMPLYDRAAQFSPYDTLAGYYDMIDEEARPTDSAAELDEHALAHLDRELALLGEKLARGERPRVRFTVFVPDGRKAGGSYRELCDAVKQIDAVHRQIVLESRSERSGLNRRLDIDRIAAFRAETADGMEKDEG